MRTLVIETATEACSVALFDNDTLIGDYHEVVGRGHAERLLPMIADLPGGGRAERILVDCGPGSFTGVRVGLAAARALGFGWSALVQGYSSMALVAAGAEGDGPLAVALVGGHGEVFVQGFARGPLTPTDALRSLAPDAAVAAIGTVPAIGSGTRLLAPLPDQPAWPVAAQVMRLPAELLCAPEPIYGRAPDAKPMAA